MEERRQTGSEICSVRIKGMENSCIALYFTFTLFILHLSFSISKLLNQTFILMPLDTVDSYVLLKI